MHFRNTFHAIYSEKCMENGKNCLNEQRVKSYDYQVVVVIWDCVARFTLLNANNGQGLSQHWCNIAQALLCVIASFGLENSSKKA